MIPHDEPHFNLGAGGYRSCICPCIRCLSAISAGCVCEDCSCQDPSEPPRNHSPSPLGLAVTEALEVALGDVVEHPCSVCGKEVVRQGTRGRWPSKCLEHR